MAKKSEIIAIWVFIIGSILMSVDRLFDKNYPYALFSIGFIFLLFGFLGERGHWQKYRILEIIGVILAIAAGIWQLLLRYG